MEKTHRVGLNPEVIEISLSDLYSFFKRNGFIILSVAFLSGVVGFGVSYLVPPEFEATSKMLPEYESTSQVGGLSDLASLAGISLGNNSSDALRPDLYPSILSSKTFLLKALSVPFTLQNGKQIFLVSYLNDKATLITTEQLAKGDTLIILTKEQENSLEEVADRIYASVDKLSGVLTIRSEMPDPALAAACTLFGVTYLKEFVAEYRGGKDTEKVAFLRNQVEEAKRKYQKSELLLSAYRDRNQNAYTNVARVQEQRLQSDFMQAQSLYGELSRQLEAARLQAMEEAPVLKVLEPPMVPNWKSKPRRILYALGFAMLGGFLALLYVFFYRERLHRALR